MFGVSHECLASSGQRSAGARSWTAGLLPLPIRVPCRERQRFSVVERNVRCQTRMPGRRLKSPAVCDYDTRQRSELSSLEAFSDCNLRGRPICTPMRQSDGEDGRFPSG